MTNSPTTEALLQTGLMDFARCMASADADELTARCLRICTDDLGFEVGVLVECEVPGAATWSTTATDPRMREVVEADLSGDNGGCRDVLHEPEAIEVDLRRPEPSWREFATHARQHDLDWAHARPLRLGETVIGALFLFGREAGDTPGEEDVEVAQALAQAAAVTNALRYRLDQAGTEVRQLQHALDSRLVIEQAKGILAARHSLTIDEAFARLRREARNRRVNIHDLSRAVIEERHTVDRARDSGQPGDVRR